MKLKTKSLSTDRIVEIIDKLRKQSYFDLRGKDKQDANTLLKDTKYKELCVRLYGVMDYRAYYTLAEEQRRELNFSFIDVKNATIKKKVKEFLIEKKITSFDLAGDMDIVVNILSAPDGVEKFKDELVKKFSTANFEFHTYVALRPLFIERYHPREAAPVISELDISSNIISQIQANYAEESLRKAYDKLLQERVLIGHSVIYDFFDLHQFRDFALIFNIQKSNESQFFKIREISEHIIDLYAIDYIRPIGYGAEEDYTTFYRGAQYLAILEFSNPKERSTWEKMVGTIFSDSNVFFFPINNSIFSGPYGTTDLEFDNRCKQYSQGTILPLGNPCNGETIDSIKVGLNIHSINKNGFILGQPRVGKTTTALRLLESFIRQKLTVHLINPTLDLVDIVKKENEGDKITEHKISELQHSKEGFKDFMDGIHIFYFEDNQSDNERSEFILKAIDRTPEVKSVEFEDIGKKDNPISCILIIDEAHDLLAGTSSKQIIHKFANQLQKLSHHGIAMYIVTQQISHLRNAGESIIPVLENRIFHLMTNGEANEAKSLLLPHEIMEDSVYNKIAEEITKLPPGRIFCSFIGNDGKSLPPLKVQIFKEKI